MHMARSSIGLVSNPSGSSSQSRRPPSASLFAVSMFAAMSLVAIVITAVRWTVAVPTLTAECLFRDDCANGSKSFPSDPETGFNVYRDCFYMPDMARTAHSPTAAWKDDALRLWQAFDATQANCSVGVSTIELPDFGLASSMLYGINVVWRVIGCLRKACDSWHDDTSEENGCGR